MDPLTLQAPAISELVSRLTPRQREIVSMLAQGKSNKEAATLLSISGATVKDHVYKACRRLEVENRTQLIVVFAMWKAIQ